MLDKYIIGDVERISPEAPVPIVHVKNEFVTLGGMGNVVRNFRAVGVNVKCIGMVGNDNEGKYIENMLIDIGADYCLIKTLQTTIIKQRIVADQRKVQMLRLDWEDDLDTFEPFVETIIQTIKDNIDNQYDYIVISDYAKGIVTRTLMTYLGSLSIPIIIDPKPQNTIAYGTVEMFTPNKKEWLEMQSKNDYLSAKYILVTEGKDGMTLYDNQSEIKIEGEPVDVYNVSGAGDTVLAIMTTCLAMGFDHTTAAKIANKCAAYVVTKPGTSIITENKFTDIVQLYDVR